MNKTAIKNFAVWARVQLIESVKQRAFEYEITENGENKTNIETIGDRLLTNEEKQQRYELIEQIRQKGYAQVMEEAAYTWFNRFIALRFMEVNGYLPSKIRVFTDENGAFKPEILKEAISVELDGLDKNKVLNLIDKQNTEELYKYLLITQCNALNEGLPEMFEKISNRTELLFPANLLRSDSVLGRMISDIPEEDWLDAVQIIGWLYQYYNSELKDDTFALLKKNVKITKERIPAATQLFTPDWIVRYMVENSLGRLWLEGHPNTELHDSWKYYLDEAEQEPDVNQQLKKICAEYANIKPEEIKIIDPCMGSGHILVYAFDVLMQIYTSAGWSERDAAKSIIENNLYGLDIDDRACQLAYFAVMMKARKYNRRILNGDAKPNVLSIQESNPITDEFIAYVAGNDANIKADLVMLRKTFKDAKEYGSILNVPAMQYDALYERMDIISRSYTENLFEVQYQSMTAELLYPLVKQSQIMSQKYDAVVTNPPYMGASGMGAKLSDYVKKNFPDSKADLFAVFIEHCGQMAKKNGYQAMITQHSWMFLSSFEKLRTKLLSVDIVNMAHLGARAFEEIGGEVVQTTSFVIRKSHIVDYKGEYCRLIEPTTQQGKEDMFLSGENRYEADQSNFSKIPGSPVAYWVSTQAINCYVMMKKTGDYGDGRIGLITGDADRFLRLWHEVYLNKIGFEIQSNEESIRSGCRWFPTQKGGEFRKWYGNTVYVVNWENDGYEMKFDNYMGTRVRSHNYNGEYGFKKAITWTTISSNNFACRYSGDGFIYDTAGPFIHLNKDSEIAPMLAFLNSVVAEFYLKIMNPTINFPPGYIQTIPFSEKIISKDVEDVSIECVALSKTDWNSYETSWDFKRSPLV